MNGDRVFNEFKQAYEQAFNLEKQRIYTNRNLHPTVVTEFLRTVDYYGQEMFNDFINKVKQSGASTVTMQNISQHVSSAFQFYFDKLMNDFRMRQSPNYGFNQQPFCNNNFNNTWNNNAFSQPMINNANAYMSAPNVQFSQQFQQISPQEQNVYDMNMYTQNNTQPQQFASQQNTQEQTIIPTKVLSETNEEKYEINSIKEYDKEIIDQHNIENILYISKAYSFEDPKTKEELSYVIMENKFPVNTWSEIIPYFDKYFKFIKKNYVYLIRYSEMMFLDIPFKDANEIYNRVAQEYYKGGSSSAITALEDIPNKFVKLLEQVYCKIINTLLRKYFVNDETMKYLIQIEHFSDISDIITKNLPTELSNITRLPGFYNKAESLIDKAFDLMFRDKHASTNNALLHPELDVETICACDEVCFIKNGITKRTYPTKVVETPEIKEYLYDFSIFTYTKTLIVTDILPNNFTYKAGKVILPEKATNVLEQTIQHCNTDAGLTNEDTLIIIKDNAKQLKNTYLMYDVGATLGNRSYIEVK